MEKLPRKIWSIHFVNKEWEAAWTSAYDKLGREYRWIVDSRLNFMLHDKKPWQNYASAACDECMENIRILDLAHSGIGGKTVYVLMWFDVDNHWMVPIHCELV